MQYHLVPTFKYSLSLSYTQHTHTHTPHIYLLISTKILSPLGDITWYCGRPRSLSGWTVSFSWKAIKEGRIGTKFQQVPQGNSKSGFQRFFFGNLLAVRVFINMSLQCRKSFTKKKKKKKWIYLQIRVLKGFHHFTWSSPLHKEKHLNFIYCPVCTTPIIPDNCTFW